ncbi:MAG: hypothetical protein GY780_14650 [bacterium]|nr:hypothetical protein [bacterium]
MSLPNQFKNKLVIIGCLMLMILMSLTGMSLAGQDFHLLTEESDRGQARASWLLRHDSLETQALTGLNFDQGEIGTSGGAGYEMESESEYNSGGASAGLSMLASAVLPGLGEAVMGHKRGYLMMAVDIFAMTQAYGAHQDGEDLRDDYYAFADAHYTDERLVEGYNPASTDQERSGEGALYFPGIEPVTDVSELHNLPLYVTPDEDFREYYENLGKWDQFIFGWDDYQRASVDRPEYDYEPTNTISDLRQPWVSQNRETYRSMRVESNDSFKKRDRWMYVNIGMRVFSVLQVAYLQGMLGGGPENKFEVAGHPVEFIAQPMGMTKGVLMTKVSF